METSAESTEQVQFAEQSPVPTAHDLTLFRQFVRDRDLSCPGCAYNLRDLTSPQCPECGQALELSLRLTEPRMAALIAGVVGLSAGAGLSGLLLIYAAYIMTVSPMSRNQMTPFVLINAAGFAIHAIALTFWLLYRARVRRLQPLWRRLLVIGCCALPLIYLVIFTKTIR